MTITKSFPSGAWSISTIVNGYRFSRNYIGYTKREAIADFKKDLKEFRRSV